MSIDKLIKNNEGARGIRATVNYSHGKKLESLTFDYFPTVAWKVKYDVDKIPIKGYLDKVVDRKWSVSTEGMFNKVTKKITPNKEFQTANLGASINLKPETDKPYFFVDDSRWFGNLGVMCEGMRLHESARRPKAKSSH